MPTLVLGREDERSILDAFVMDVKDQGAALLMRGDAGIGKSTLVGSAIERARAEGMSVLTASGVRSEMHLPFAGLHELLRPVIGLAETLAPLQRDALMAAFGKAPGRTADPYLTALASLELFAEVAAEAPVLVVLDDTHWLDRPSVDAFAFVARRIASEPIVMLVTARNGYESPFVDLGLNEMDVEPLDRADAAALLECVAPDLVASERERILVEAAGNPLSIVELPRAMHSRASTPMGISDRLVETFWARTIELPGGSQLALLVASLDAAAGLQATLAAAGSLAGRRVTRGEIEVAEGAGLVRVNGDVVRFRHPLVPAAIASAAPPAARRAAHAALADEHADDPDRSAWHRAASLEGPDDTVATALRSVASRAVDRGAPQVAVLAVERAAALTLDPAERGPLLIQGAQMHFELGHPSASLELLEAARGLPLSPYHQARLAFLTEIIGARTWTGADRIPTLVEMARAMLDEGHAEQSLEALFTIALRAWWSDVDPETRDAIVDLVDGIPLASDAPPRIAILAMAHPMRCGAEMIERISRTKPDASDPLGALAIGMGATAVWAQDLSLPFLEVAVNGLRLQGRRGLLTQALVAQAWSAAHLALEPLAVSASQEAMRLAHETGQPLWEAAAQLAHAVVLAERGDLEAAEAEATHAESILVPLGGGGLLALAQLVRGRGAVAHHHCGIGLEYLTHIVTRIDPAYHPFVGTWVLSDLVEACVHTGQPERAAAYFEQLQALAERTNGGLLRCEAAYARPFVTDDDHAEEAFQAGLERLAGWPCFRGRMLLWYGRWLRRQRRVAESRAPLRAAKQRFESLAFRRLAEQANEELRAAGEIGTVRTDHAWTTLSPQELQIARLAASGMTNREIGERLFLSHRTVGSHLHRLFPKLGVTSRGQLRDALQAATNAS
jgi:DNA-binding CsgD family transcriptional regulator